MKTKVFGQRIKYSYSVDNKRKTITGSNGEPKMVYTDKPTMKQIKNVEWVEICEFEGEPRYNSGTSMLWDNSINISEDEEVAIREEIFRADLNELHLHTSKVLEETDLNKNETDILLENEIKMFNKEMIESDEKLKLYCNIHKLNPEDTDCIELYKLVYSTDLYCIFNGKFVVNNGTYTMTYCGSFKGDSITATSPIVNTTTSAVIKF